MNLELDTDFAHKKKKKKSEEKVLRGRKIESELERQQEHPDLSTVIDYVLFTFHCFDAQSGQVFY